MQPLISCVCLTIPGRAHFLRRAVECFRKQTWENRELIVVAEPDQRVSLDGPAVLPHLRPGRWTVGEKRNVGCLGARGEYIALWDDDDFSAPNRLTEQMRVLQESGKSVTTLPQIYFTNEACDQWWLSERGWIDTSLVFKRSWWEQHNFPDKMIGQDVDFMRAADQAGEFVVGGKPDLMFATNHKGNTCDRSFYGPERALKNFKWEHPCSVL